MLYSNTRTSKTIALSRPKHASLQVEKKPRKPVVSWCYRAIDADLQLLLVGERGGWERVSGCRTGAISKLDDLNVVIIMCNISSSKFFSSFKTRMQTWTKSVKVSLSTFSVYNTSMSQMSNAKTQSNQIDLSQHRKYLKLVHRAY